MKKYFVILLMLPLIQSCQPTKNSTALFTDDVQTSKIINGALLADEQLPQMSKIVSSKGLCSATLVGPNVIITAAHCLNNETNQTFGPVNGAYYKVVLTMHPEYSGSRDFGSMAVANDVALGILEKEIADVAPASIANQFPQVDERVMMAGCGQPISGIRQFGFSNVYSFGNTGITLSDTVTNNPQILDRGDSGGSSFMVNAKNEISLFAVSSTSNFTWGQGVANVVDNSKNPNAIFIKKFITDNNLKVCGINTSCAPLQLISQGTNYKMDVTFEVDSTNKLNLKFGGIGNNAVLMQSVQGDLVYAETGKIEHFANIDVKDKIVLIARGEISFTEKLTNAVNAGAKGLIIFNTSDAAFDGGLTNPASFPISVINNTDGKNLVNILGTNAKISVQFNVTTQVYKF